MKILLTGASGMAGSRFVELSKNYDFITPSYPEFDLTNKQSVEKVFSDNKPEVVVHFAAYTDVGQAENQRNDKNGDCWNINVNGTKNLISEIDPIKTHFIHISTDYVFPGSKINPGPYKEDSIPEENPDKVTWYGFSKAQAEREVNNLLGENKTILRIIYPVRAKYDQKMDYLRKPLSLYDQGKLYPMFTDQRVSITFIDEVAMVLEKIINQKIYGTYHCCSTDTSSPYDLVSYLLKKVRNVENVVKQSSLDDFIKNTNNSEVRYPKFGGLNPKMTEEKLGIKLSSWKEIIDRLSEQGISY